MSPQDAIRQLEGIARRDPRGEVIAACRRCSAQLREGRAGVHGAVLGELLQLSVTESARPALRSVLAWAQGQTPYMNRAL